MKPQKSPARGKGKSSMPALVGTYFGEGAFVALDAPRSRTLSAVKARAAAEQYVLYRLVQMGFDAEPASNPHADVVACSPEGTRVALIRVHERTGEDTSLRASDVTSDARNRAHLFVDFTGLEPVCFVVPAPVVARELRASGSWPGRGLGALEPFREAWHLLGLSRRSSTRSAPVVSPSSPSA
jgi:hypothetical protein